jgi:type II secretory pathway pseudopilin PulG
MADEKISFLDKHFATIATIIIALCGGAFSLVQYHGQQVEKKRIEDQRTIDLQLQIAKYVYDGRDDIFSGSEEKRRRMRDVMKATFPSTIYNKVFGEIANNSPNKKDKEFWLGAQNIKPGFTQLSSNNATKTNNLKKQSISKITPRVSATELQSVSKTTGSNLYQFNIWLDLLPEDKAAIQQVVYTFNHPTWGKDNKDTSKTPENGFMVSYEGWGAINSVDIDIYYKNGSKRKANVDMLAALGW